MISRSAEFSFLEKPYVYPMLLSHQKFDLWGKCLIERVRVKAPFRYQASFPEEACFIHFSKGSTLINTPGEQTPIAHKDSVLLKCGAYFSDFIDHSKEEEYEILVIHLLPEMLQRVFQFRIPPMGKPDADRPYINKVPKQEVVIKFIESLYFYFDNPGLVSDELLELKVKELILLLIKTESMEALATLFHDIFTPRKLNIKEVVHKHLFSNLSIEDLATLCNLSLSTFNRTFKDIFQDSPANYLKNQRLERAKELLQVSSLNIGEIAFQTCFADVSHLSRAFKSRYGLAPSTFREQFGRN